MYHGDEIKRTPVIRLYPITPNLIFETQEICVYVSGLVANWVDG